MLTPGTPGDLGAYNRKIILDCVRKQGPISRAELSRRLELSFPAVSSNAKKLLDSHFLREAGYGNNAIGRKSTLLEFNATWGYIIGADIGRSQIRVMLSDLEGKEVVYLKQDYHALDGEHSAEECLIGLIEEAIANGGLKAGQVKFVSLGIPGIIDPKTGKLILVPFMTPIDIQQMTRRIESVCHSPVFVENSVNLGAIGEKWKGVARGYRDILYFSHGVGIGSALILNGELYRGVNNAAGEVGYMVPDLTKIRDHFDEQGVLESLVSGSSIQDSMIRQGLGQDFQGLLMKSKDNSQAAQELVSRISLYVGIMLINVVSVLNIELIVIGGRLGDFLSPSLIPGWRDVLAGHVPFVPEIMTSTLREKASVLGGIAIGMRTVNDTLVEQIP